MNIFETLCILDRYTTFDDAKPLGFDSSDCNFFNRRYIKISPKIKRINLINIYSGKYLFFQESNPKCLSDKVQFWIRLNMLQHVKSKNHVPPLTFH